MSTKGIAQRRSVAFFPAFLLAAVFAAGLVAHAQTDGPAWLRYAPLQMPAEIPISVRALSTDQLEQSAVQELESGLAGLSGHKVQTTESGEIVVGTLDEVHAAFPGLQVPVHLPANGFWLKKTDLERLESPSARHRRRLERARRALWRIRPCCAGSQRALTSHISMRSKPQPCPSAGSTSGTTPAAPSSAATAAGRFSLRAERSATI